MQAIARSLYQAGYGSIQFFIPLIFVNQLGLSATVVGIGIGSGSLAGFVGHWLGGYLADSPAYGRKRALLFSAELSIIAAIALALNQSLPMLVVPEENRFKQLTVLSVANLLGETIWRVHEDSSVSSMFR